MVVSPDFKIIPMTVSKNQFNILKEKFGCHNRVEVVRSCDMASYRMFRGSRVGHAGRSANSKVSHHLRPEGRSRYLGQTQLQKTVKLHANGQKIFTLSAGLHMLVHD